MEFQQVMQKNLAVKNPFFRQEKSLETLLTPAAKKRGRLRVLGYQFSCQHPPSLSFPLWALPSPILLLLPPPPPFLFFCNDNPAAAAV